MEKSFFKQNISDQTIFLKKNLYHLEDFYFAHSFYIDTKEKDISIAFSKHSEFKFNSIIKKKHILGCQFHPEKSGDIGLSFLNDFCN